MWDDPWHCADFSTAYLQFSPPVVQCNRETSSRVSGVVPDSSFERLASLAEAVSLTGKFIARLSKQSDEGLPHRISVLHRNGGQKPLGSRFHPDTRVNNKSVGNKI